MSEAVPDLTGKRAVVTGATSGLGTPLARALARAGAEVIVVGRDPSRTARVVADIGGKARGEVADFASLKAVAALAERIGDAPLDILVNNAGLINLSRRLSEDGYELTFAVNHLAPFLLTERLVPALRAAPAGRVVTTSSAAEDRATLQLDDLMATKRYSGMAVYSQSKLANVMFTVELARRLDGTNVTANCFHPGVVATRFGEKGGVMGLVWTVARPFLLTPEQGADTGVWLASSPELRGVTGQFYAKRRIKAMSKQAKDAGECRRLWLQSERLVAATLAK